jgi:hypothetical protein
MKTVHSRPERKEAEGQQKKCEDENN